MEQKEFVSRLDVAKIVEAIREVERGSTAEIRVHIQPRAIGGDIRHVAQKTFERLGMTKTEARNGVLLFIASEDQQFAIIGDKGIHDFGGQELWEGIVARLMDAFRASRFTDGIIEAVQAVGGRLSLHFPYRAGDLDELPNEISISSGDDHGSP